MWQAFLRPSEAEKGAITLYMNPFLSPSLRVKVGNFAVEGVK
jgi:hypothetical protein